MLRSILSPLIWLACCAPSLAALAIDGTPQGGTATGGTTCAPAAFTTGGAGIVVFATHAEAVTVQGAHPTVSGVSGGGLTWAKRSSQPLDNAGFGNAYNNLEIWWAFSAGALVAQTITVTWGGVTIDDMSCVVFGVNGFTGTDYQTNPWDANASLPAKASAGTTTVPTVSGVTSSNAAVMVLGIAASGGGGNINAGNIAGSAATSIIFATNGGGTNNSSVGAFQSVFSSAQTSITVDANNTKNGWMIIADVLAQIGTPALTGGPVRLLLGVGK